MSNVFKMLLLNLLLNVTMMFTRLSRDTASGTQPLYSSGVRCASVSSRLIAAVTTPCTISTVHNH